MAKTKELTPKQKIFCEQYVFDWNATRAAKEAGYSEKTAYSIGQENLKKPEIQDYIEEIQSDLSKLAGVSALRNLNELKKIAYSTLQNYHSNWMTLEAWDKVSAEDKAAISELSHVTTGSGEYAKTVVKFKLHDKGRAIEAINKMLGFNSPEKFDHTTKGKKITQPDLSANIISKLIDRL